MKCIRFWQDDGSAVGQSRRATKRRVRPALRGGRLLILLVGLGTLSSGAAERYEVIKSFGFPDQLGRVPMAPLILASDGTLYGTTSAGGSNDQGTVFKVNRDGSGLAVLHAFSSPASSPLPQSGLLEGSNGALYGGTWSGGESDSGTVFRLNKDGSGYSILHSFRNNLDDGSSAVGELIEGDDGVLYGVTFGGTVYRISRDGSGFTVLHRTTWSVTDGDGAGPNAGLIKGQDGVLYGTSTQGGEPGAGHGTVFKIKQDGSGYAILHRFGQAPDDGLDPRARLVEGTGGFLYGTTGISGNGTGRRTVFRINRNGSGYQILHQFTNTAFCQIECGLVHGTNDLLYGIGDGAVFSLREDGTEFTLLHAFNSFDGGDSPGGLVMGNDGVLYGITQGSVTTAGSIFRLNPDGSGYRVLVRFLVAGGDGTAPPAGLLQGTDGTFYGVTSTGGSNGGGTLFRINSDGSGYSTLHSFPGLDADGYGPTSGLLQGNDGMLYGTTASGGSGNFGTVFRLNSDGSDYSTVHNFEMLPGTGSLAGGCPVALGAMSKGVLYGTTRYLGTNGSGTLFRLNLDGSGFQTLHDFGTPGSRDGLWPSGAPLLASDGKLYGTTYGGGTNSGGTVYRINPDGTGYVLLRQFAFGGRDAAAPEAGLTEGSDGMLYGTTSQAAMGFGGSVFKMNKDGSGFEILHNLLMSEGTRPTAGVIEGNDGALYSTTSAGGPSGAGTVFRLNKNGTQFTLLHSFTTWPWRVVEDGENPVGVLIQGTDGAFYGATRGGGLRTFPGWGFGTIFRLLPPETPQLLGVTPSSGNSQVTLNGASGCRYQLLRSTDLKKWMVLTTVTMPDTEVAEVLDDSPPTPAAFYRVNWQR